MKRIARLLLLAALAAAVPAYAEDFFSDIMLIGGNESEVTNLKATYAAQGWRIIDQDLNAGAGGDFVYLLYKTAPADVENNFISAFYIKQGSGADETMMINGATYILAPCVGGSHFVSHGGDLNSNTGSGSDSIHLYYSRVALSGRLVTGVRFDADSTGALGKNGGTSGYDLNKNAGGDFIYMHVDDAVPSTLKLEMFTASTTVLSNGVYYGITGASIYQRITVQGKVQLFLDGLCRIYAGHGIELATGNKLVIHGHGILDAFGTDNKSGIGSSCYGTLVVNGGTINATGASHCAGIGGDSLNTIAIDSRVIINGGTVNAQGGWFAAGIGGGWGGVFSSYYPDMAGSGGYCTITGGKVRSMPGRGDLNGVPPKIHWDSYGIGAGLNGRMSAYIHFGWKNATDYIETMDVWAEFDRPFVLDDDRTIVEYTMLFDTNTTYKIVPPGGVAVYHANGGSGEMPTQVFLLGEEQALSGCGFGLPPGAAAFTGWNTAPDGSGTAYAPGQTLTPETRASFYLDLYAQWETLDWAGESGGDSPETAYLIQSAEQFDLLAKRVSAGQDYAGKHFRLTRDISVRTAVGNPSGRVRPFRGTFDGCGHDLEIDYDSGNQATAPFRCVDGAVIRNLRTKGCIAAGGKYAAGIVGCASGTTVVSNCLSSVEIASAVSGEGSHGGIVGRVSGGTTRIVGCVFEGKMLGGATTHWGGFVGTVESGAAAEVVDGLFAPAEVTAGTAGSQTFACAANPDAVTLRNAIYARCADALATGQGRMGRSISLSGGAKYVGEERAYDTSSLMAVGDSVLCFFRKNNYYRYVYGGVGQTVALDYKPPAPRHEFAGFVATCGEEDVTATAIDGSMLTVPDADVAVSAAYLRILTPWETLQMQLDSGGTVVLTNDVAAADDESSLMVTNAVALDLNGHTINGIDEKAVVLVAEGGHLTLTNSAAGGGSPVCPPGAITGGYRGVFVDWGGAFTLSGGAISDNKAGDGGGVFVADEGVFTMAEGTISGNVAEGEGGGVFVEDGGVFMMTGGTISDNVADDEGGGVFVEDGAGFTMTGGTISDNAANDSGGGVYVEISGTFKMAGGEISANSASYGGGMYVEEYGTFTLSGGVIRDNRAKWMGGGVYLDEAEMTVSGSPVISGNDTLDEDASNVCMPDGASIILAGLTAGASIGVSTESIPAWFATGATADDAAYFFSDEFGDASDLIRIRAREFDDTWYLVLEKNYPAYLDEAYDFVIENYESWTAKYGPDTNGTHEAHFLLNIDPATPIPEGAALLKVTDFRIERGILYMELGSDVADLVERTPREGKVADYLCNGFISIRSGSDLSNTVGWWDLDASLYPGENGRVVVVYPLNALLPYDEGNDQPGPVPPSWYFLPTISIQPPGYYFPQ